ncbi:MAG: phosphodiesterase [Micrococcales bacterium]|nr:MAG: phosphodiesterase [Micrococcales bacterium]PIE27904.1 MAG: phosphodiesterase [Micrococcales bacterium]
MSVTHREHPGLPSPLRRDIDQAGYYPAFVGDLVATGLGGEEVLGHLVHQETAFDAEEIRRHVTVLVVTPTRLLAAHADDHTPDAHSATVYASGSTEAVPLAQVRTVVLQHMVVDPAKYRAGDGPRELTLTIGWGSVQRIDLEPAVCADPQCEADHGYTGAMSTDDIVIRISAEAEGGDAVAAATEFARVLAAATGQQLRTAAL